MQWLILLLLNSYSVDCFFNDDEIVHLSASKVIVHAGKPGEINVSVEVKNGYHIQAHNVKDEFIIPTTLIINGTNEFKIKKQIFPSTKKFKLEGTDDYLKVYDGSFEIYTFFTTTKTIQKGIYHLDGKLNYQACDSVRCLAPRSVQFLIEVDVQ